MNTELKFPSKIDSPCFFCGKDDMRIIYFKNVNDDIPPLPIDACIHFDCYVKLLVDIRLKELEIK